MQQLLPILAGHILLAHNASIERSFIHSACQHCFGGPFFVPTIDTLQLALLSALNIARELVELRESGGAAGRSAAGVDPARIESLIELAESAFAAPAGH